MKKVALFATIIFALSTSIAFAYKSPGKPQGFVNDFAGVLSAQDKADLETTLSNFNKETGNQIVIATVNSLDGETEQTYAVKLFEEWGIGQKGKDNGLLILQAPNERKIRIEVGYGLEPYITDAQASLIYRNVLSPAFKVGNYGQGYKDAVGMIIGTFQGQTDVIPQDSPSDYGGSIGNWIFFIILIPLWLASILGRSKSWWFGGVLGGVVGIVIGSVYGFNFIGIIIIPVLVVVGLLFDFIVSKAYNSRISQGLKPPWWIGGGGRGGGFGGGGFGGFGGGSSGGGGGGGGY